MSLSVMVHGKRTQNDIEQYCVSGSSYQGRVSGLGSYPHDLLGQLTHLEDLLITTASCLIQRTHFLEQTTHICTRLHRTWILGQVIESMQQSHLTDALYAFVGV